MARSSLSSISVLASMAVSFLAAAPLSAGLRHGDKAPPLAITKWVKGDAVDLAKLDEKKVVVVEFWATWCGPCIMSIPHLSELQKKHAKDVVVIGVTKPDRNNPLNKVEEFVETQGDKMAYTVAFDGDAKTYAAYMEAAEQTGIPTAFIVDKKGQLAWIGHPMRMDKPLAEIVDGTFDVEKASAQFETAQKARKLYPQFMTGAREGDLEAAGKAAKELVALAKDDEAILNNVAWTLLTHPQLEGKFNGLALEAAERCDELSESASWMYLDTLALARFENGKVTEAIKTQKKAIDLAKKENAPADTLREFEDRLARFEKKEE